MSLKKIKMNNWKITGIISIVFNVLLIALFVFLMFVGSTDVQKENECVVNVCSMDNAASYDYYDGVCECYNNLGFMIHQEIIS